MFIPAAIHFTDAVVEQACVEYPLLSDLCADEVEQRLIRAYVRLVFQPAEISEPRGVAVMRLGSVEVHLTEVHPAHTRSDLPPFWSEVMDASTDTSIDSLGFRDFDEDQLATAVEMIVNAAHEAGLRHGLPPH